MRGMSRAKVLCGGILSIAATICILGAIFIVVLSSPAPAASLLTRYEQTDSRIAYAGDWDTFERSLASQGTYDRANTLGTSATIYFQGTQLDWIAMKGTTTGRADVSVDGRAPVTIDLSSSVAVYQQRVFSTGTLANGAHNVKISWDTDNLSGKYITLDAVEVAGTLSSAVPPPTTSTTTPIPPTAFNVKTYGAKGDGTTDDAPAIQRAVEAARAAGGGVVYLPAGKYRLYTPRSLDGDLGANIQLYSNITVRGAGPDKTFVSAAYSWASAFGALRQHDVSIQDLDITSGGTENGDAIKFGVVTDALIQNVVAHDIYIGIAMYSCTNPVIRNCKVYNTDAGIKIAPGATWSEPALGGLVEDCEGWGSNAVSFRVGGKNAVTTGVTFRRCYSHTSGGCGILLTNAKTLTIDGCTSKDGFYIAGVNGAKIIGSTPSPFVVTASNYPDLYNIYGASSNIVIQ